MARRPYPQRSSRTHTKQHKSVNALFSVKTHRFPRLPKASELGISYTQRAALSRIRRLEAELIEELSVWDIKVAETRLAAIETLMQQHFGADTDWRRLNAARQPIAFPDQQPSTSVASEPRALAS